MIDQKTIDTIYILKILVWAFNFITNKITSGLNIFFLTKNTMLLFYLTIYSTLLAKRHHHLIDDDFDDDN